MEQSGAFMFKQQLTIGKKIGFGFAMMLLLAAALMAISRFALSTSSLRFTSLLENETAVFMHASTAKIALLEARRNEKDLLYADDQTLVGDSNKHMAQMVGELESIQAMVGKTADPQLVSIVQNLRKSASEYQNKFQTMIQTPVGQERMIAVIGMRKAANATESMLNDFLKAISARITNETQKTHDYITLIGNMALLIGLLVMAGGSLLAFFITRAITRPLNSLQRVISDVESSGDLSRRVSIRTGDEVGQTAKSFNQLMETLQGALSQILDGVAQVSEAALSLSTSSTHVANSSSQQSEAASTMAATVEQVTVSINHVSSNAGDALELSRKSGELSNQGRTIIHNARAEMVKIADTVRQTSATIEDLGRKSDEISSIVLVIKDIADQTNLLALNAAIEAARAGEQGRGFAVVADEVRKLADRTTQSTEKIIGMISTMQSSSHTAVAGMAAAVHQVGSGVELAQRAGEAIDQIKDGAEQVIKVVTDISSALVEQSSASNNIATNVEKVARMSEENEAAASQTASEVLHLERLAEAMRGAVSRFKIER
jgi:methyl-accepting chemotaxis protein